MNENERFVKFRKLEIREEKCNANLKRFRINKFYFNIILCEMQNSISAVTKYNKSLNQLMNNEFLSEIITNFRYELNVIYRIYIFRK